MYCSIQEAWGTDFNEGFDNYKGTKMYQKKNYTKQNNKTKKLPFIHQEEEKGFRGAEKQYKENKNTREFSRGITRLPEHNGPEIRDIGEQIIHEDHNDDYQKDEPQKDDYQNYENQKDNYQNLEYQKDDYEEREILSKRIDENPNSTHNLSFLVDKINLLIDKYDRQGETNNTNIILFILIGIFIIFVLESILKFGKYLRD